MREERRVLVVRTGAMGDVLHGLAAVAALRVARPGWEIGWAIEPRWRALLASGDARGERGMGRPVVDRVHLVRTRDWKARPMAIETVRDVLALRRELREARYDVCVDLQGLIRSAMVGRMAGAGRYVGMAHPRERVAAWMYGERVRTTAVHVVEQGCQLLGAAVGAELAPGRVELPRCAAAEAWVDGVVQRLGAVREVVVLAPTAGWGAKAWPPERYGRVGRELSEAGYGCVVNAVSQSDATARVVVEASGGRVMVAAGGVAELIALVRRAGLVVAGDSGPLHLGAALGVPVVGLYGPTDPARNGPWVGAGVGGGARSVVLRHAGSVTDHRRSGAVEAGLLRIGVEEVTVAAMGLLGETGESGRGDRTD